jgi:hypothetical protein
MSKRLVFGVGAALFVLGIVFAYHAQDLIGHNSRYIKEVAYFVAFGGLVLLLLNTVRTWRKR